MGELRHTASLRESTAPHVPVTAPPLNHHPSIRTYGRRAQRMTDAQRRSYANRRSCPWYVDGEPELGALRALISENARRSAPRPLILELGCGMGVATVEYARRNATHTIVAIELYCAGIARIISEIDRYHLRNLYIIEGDGLALLPRLFMPPPLAAAASPSDAAPPHHSPAPPLSGVHIFFPDPWPKKKHRKRRMVGEQLMRTLIDLLQPNGHLSFVSDHRDYAEEVARCAAALPLTPMYAAAEPVTAAATKSTAGQGRSRVMKVAQAAPSLSPPPPALLCDTRPRWRPETKFEQKARRNGSSVWEGHWRRAVADETTNS